MVSKLRAARLEANLSIDEAAEKIGIPGGFLSQIERGTRSVTEELGNKIAVVYGRTMADLFAPIRFAVCKVSNREGA